MHAAALAPAWLLGCGGTEAAPAPLLEIERLAFVPPGGFTWERVECTTPRALLVERREVTRAQFGDWAARAGVELLPPVAGTASELDERLPATGMDLAAARAFAASRGMRLPSAVEWLRIAGGSSPGRPWPWGSTSALAFANTSELGLFRPLPVGSLENGCTPEGVYDLLGNVWEWVEPPLPGIRAREVIPDPHVRVAWELAPAPAFGPLANLPRPRFALRYYRTVRVFAPIDAYGDLVSGVRHRESWAMGGSYLFHAVRLVGLGRQEEPFAFGKGLEPGYRASDLGLRCVADAEEFLVEHAHRWSRPALRERMQAVGRSRSWQRDAVPLLEALAARADAPAAIGWLLEGARP